MRGFRNLLQETHRRAVWQVLGTYLAGAWLVLQVVEVLMETIGLPDWVPKFALVLLLMGLPIMVATAVIQGAAKGKAEPPSASERASDPGEPARPAPSQEAVSDSEAMAEPDGVGRGRRLFTWRNAALGGVVAFALLGLVTAGWMAMRGLGIGPVGSLVASGVIDEGDRVILAEFSGDSALAAAATLAFRVDLAQSDVVSTADPAYLSSVLRRMQRPTDTPLDAALAREVAIREGIKAVIAGDISAVGGSHVLTARLLAAGSGDELAAFRETADDSTRIMRSIDRLSKRMRERLGESLRSIHANEPLASVTTGSLRALQKYSQAWTAISAGDNDRGIALLEESIRLDSTFAMAWRKLATATGGDRRVETATKAYELRDRLTDRERYHTLGIYHTYVTEDLQQAVTAYRTLLDAHPDDATALNNLGVVYGQLGEREQSIAMYRRAMRVDPLTARYPMNMIPSLYDAGEADSARATLDRFAGNLPDHPGVVDQSFQLATAEHRYEEARAYLDRRLDHENPASRSWARIHEALFTLLEGRVADANRMYDALEQDDDAEHRLMRQLERAAEIDLRVRGDTTAAVRLGLAALDRYAESTPIEHWPLDDLIFLFGEAGRPEIARPYVAEWKTATAAVDSTTAAVFGGVAEQYLTASELFHAGRGSEALPILRDLVRTATDAGFCDVVCEANLLATGFDMAAQPDSAIAWYEKYLESPNFSRFNEDAQHLHRVYHRLGRLYDEQGDLDRAKLYYAKYTELWENADAELQPRVEAVRRRLAEILEASGPAASDSSGRRF